MRDAPTSSAVNGAQRPVSPDVLCGGLRMAFDFDRPELKVDPWSADTATQRAVAGRGNVGLGRQGHSNRAAVA